MQPTFKARRIRPHLLKGGVAKDLGACSRTAIVVLTCHLKFPEFPNIVSSKQFSMAVFTFLPYH